MATLDLTRDLPQHLDLDAELALLTPRDRQAAINTWRGRMLNEFVSARIFAALIPQMMAAGVPASQIEAVAGMVSDELRHGRMCASVVVALGGEARVEMPDLDAVPGHEDAEDALEALLRNVLSVSCLSETVAVALISAEQQTSGPPALDHTLRSILADEVQHARFGWTLLESVSDRFDAPLRQRLGDYLIDAFTHLREHELAHLPPVPTTSEVAERVGVCDGEQARVLFFDTVEQVIIPRLEELGLPATAAWRASLADTLTAQSASA